MRKISLSFLLFICILFIGNSCSTGSDPEDVIDDVFAEPVEVCLNLQNVFNDLSMNINGIVMHNLEFEDDTITKDVEDCLDALVYRDEETLALDSIILDFGSSDCDSNGGSFEGEVVVEPLNDALTDFDVRLSDFYAGDYEITGTIEFQITGETAGDDFAISLSDAEFMDDDSLVYSVSSLIGTYTFIEDEEDDDDYTDDIFDFTVSMSGETSDGIAFYLESESDLTYAYSCENIIGGDAVFTLEDVSEGEVDYGGGSTDYDCDTKVSVSIEGATIHVYL
ncbi:hypothetical protein [Labilibaculum sp.]|uniref:hypothetical protein n=1 Tax=Labilibaculum sp. TaxID=2060723 RepID=UPI0035682973